MYIVYIIIYVYIYIEIYIHYLPLNKIYIIYLFTKCTLFGIK